MSSRILILTMVLAICTARTACAQEDDSFYNITSAEVTQMNNAVQIVIAGDGVMAPNMDLVEQEHADYNKLMEAGWRYNKEVSRPVESLHVHFSGARLLVNGLAPVDKYPVSHLEFSTATGAANSPQVDLKVCLYTTAYVSRVRSQWWDDRSTGVDWGDVVRLDVALAEDQQSLIVTVISDRLPDAPEHRSVDDLEDDATELSVTRDGERFDIHAKNAPLSDFVRELQSASGRRVKMEGAAERVVTAEIPGASFDDLVADMCRCYGLTSAGSPESETVLSEAAASSNTQYDGHETRRIPLKWLRADKALGLLPNFLLSCVRVDRDNNQLVVAGSPEFADKLAADVAVVDQPPRSVNVEATLVEVSSTVDVNTALALTYRNSDLDAAVEPPSVQFGVAKSALSPAEFDAKLDAMIASGAARAVNNANLTALSGEQGTLFVGVDKYIQVNDLMYERDKAIPVKAGTNLTIMPLVTGAGVQIALSAEVSRVSVVDPATRLPVIDTRKISSTLQVRSGECIVVGGMDQIQQQATRRRIPILGYLPIIGGLFRTTVKQHSNTRLMLLLTPRIVEDWNCGT